MDPLAQVATSSGTLVVTASSAPNMSEELAKKSMPAILDLQRADPSKTVSVIGGPMTHARNNNSIEIQGAMHLMAGPPPEDEWTITIKNTGTTDGFVYLFDVLDLHKSACNGCTSTSTNNSLIASSPDIKAFIGSIECNQLLVAYKLIEKFRYPLVSMIVEDITPTAVNRRLSMTITGEWRNGSGDYSQKTWNTRKQVNLFQQRDDIQLLSPPSNTLFTVLDYTGRWKVPVLAGQTIELTLNLGPRTTN